MQQDDAKGSARGRTSGTSAPQAVSRETRTVKRPAAEGPPLFDGRRGGGAFPFEGEAFPGSISELREGMELAYAKRLVPPDDERSAVRADGDSLEVDVSGWRVRPEYEPAQFGRELAASAVWRVRRVAYIADPLHYEAGKMSLRLWAEDAELHGLRDRSRAAVVLAGARRGELRFSAGREELSRVMTAGARRGAGRAGVRVEQLAMTVDTPSPNRLTLSVSMSGSWLLLPMRLTIVAGLVIDADQTAVFEPFVVRGEGPAGELLAPLIRAALRRTEGRRSPLMAFRDGRTRATSFHAGSGERLEVTITFGRPDDELRDDTPDARTNAGGGDRAVSAGVGRTDGLSAPAALRDAD